MVIALDTQKDIWYYLVYIRELQPAAAMRQSSSTCRVNDLWYCFTYQVIFN